MSPPLVRESLVVHGHRRAFVRAGSGPALLLLHGIGNNCQTWAGVIGRLAESHTVIAPDLLGHGASDKPRGDYSIAAYANGMRDLLIGARHRAGHRGRALARRRHRAAVRLPVPRALRAARAGRQRRAGPGALRRAARGHAARRRTGAHRPDRGLRAAAHGASRPWTGSGSLAGWRRVRDLAEAGDALLALKDVEARRAFLRTLRGVVDAHGQAVTALDRLYLADAVPMLVDLGQPRPDRPGPARRDGAHAGADRPRRGLPRAPGTGRTSTSPTTSATCCSTSSRPPSPPRTTSTAGGSCSPRTRGASSPAAL